MKQITLLLPAITFSAQSVSWGDIDVLRVEFEEKVAEPFNKAFASCKRKDDERVCFDLTTEDTQYPFRGVAWGRFFHLLQNTDEDDEPVFYAHFCADGTAYAKEPSADGEILKQGNWIEIFSFILTFISSELGHFTEGFESAKRQLHTLGLIWALVETLEAGLPRPTDKG